MKCHDIQEFFPDYLVGDLDDKRLGSIQTHLADCGTCRTELENLSAAWTKLGVIPEQRPSDSLKLRFYTMLDAFKQGLEEKNRESRLQRMLSSWLERWWPRNPVLQFSLTLMVLVIGLTGGLMLNRSGRGVSDLAPLRQEVSQMRQAVAASLMINQSASERIRGITMSYQLDQPGDDLLQGLVKAMNSDPNINVRLAAVDALFLFRNHPIVKPALYESLQLQESPLIQMALIDLIVNIRETQAADALRTLILNNNLNEAVKEKAQEGLDQLF